MGLFGDFEFKEKKKKSKTTLFSMAQERFKNDAELVNELILYLRSRQEQHNLPTKISWGMQLALLDGIEPAKRVNQVHTATIRGWRQIAYDNSDKNYVNRNKSEVNIINKGF